MKEIIEVVRTGKSPSQVVVGEVITSLRSYLPEKRVIVISDANIHRRYRDLVGQFEYLLIGMGETSKTLATVENIYRQLIDLGVGRDCFILGIGGGIVTDVAGFVASTYMRGVSFGFIATTLLSQVDASIGGKNGVNVDGYKNMVGAFNQPDFVLCDTGMLATLPEKEFRAGLAEIVKTGVIADPALFSLLERSTFEELRSNVGLLRETITAAVRVKAMIVTGDEREGGVRKKLNLGHTFGHAIEKAGKGYSHGEAVAVGLSMICDLAVRLGALSPEDRARIKGVLERFGLPLQTSVDERHLLKAVAMDKKCAGKNIDLVIPHAIGDCRITPMPLDELQTYY